LHKNDVRAKGKEPTLFLLAYRLNILLNKSYEISMTQTNIAKKSK